MYATTRELARLADLLATTPPGADHDAIAAQAETLAAAARNKMDRALNGVENADAEEHTAWGRAETDACERGTVGCSVLHTTDSECATW